MGQSLSFVVVDENDLLCDLLRQWLLAEYPQSSVSRYSTVAAVLDDLAKFGNAVDVLIAESRLPDGEGVDVAVALRKVSGTEVSAVIMSGRPTADLFNRMSLALHAGWAFIHKRTSGIENLRQAISVAQSGLVMVDPQLRNSSGPSDVEHLLTESEREILKRVAEGKANKIIAEELFTSEKTVERHLSAVYQKLSLDGKSKAVNPRVAASLRYLGLI